MYYYPRLSTTDLGFIRIGGPGLANCLFVACRAYVASVKENGSFIEPTWLKFSVGPLLRKEKDKRFYSNLFKHYGVSGLRKVLILSLIKFGILKHKSFTGLGDYFSQLLPDYDLCINYINQILKPDILSFADIKELSNSVSVHIRLGDFPQQYRVPLSWYKEVIQSLHEKFPEQKFILFSDGSDDELKDFLNLPYLKRRFYGNAIADMYAISKTKLLIASDSTFSAWGAFMGRVPLIFYQRHFPPVFGDSSEAVIGNSIDIPETILCRL